MKVIKTAKYETINMGLAGYSDKEFDVELAKKYIVEAFDRVENMYEDKKFKLVSGWSDMGIPALGYREAKKRGWKTVGVACAEIDSLDKFPVDEGHKVGEKWGDESPFFVDFIEILIKIGGGEQSEKESIRAKEWGKTVISYSLEELKE